MSACWLCSVVMAASSLSLDFSYNYMDVGIASSILFVYPVLVAPLMAILYHEKARDDNFLPCHGNGRHRAALRRRHRATLDPFGDATALTSALTYAVYIVMVKVSGDALIYFKLTFLGPAVLHHHLPGNLRIRRPTLFFS